MAHFAMLDDDNNVINIIVVGNEDCLLNDKEDEATGISFCQNLLGKNTKWVQTSYNNNFRQRYAQIGGKYDANIDAFIHIKPFQSWIMDEKTGEWKAPKDKPSEGDFYWDEENQKWVESSKYFETMETLKKDGNK
jgi:hypothetical protein